MDGTFHDISTFGPSNGLRFGFKVPPFSTDPRDSSYTDGCPEGTIERRHQEPGGIARKQQSNIVYLQAIPSTLRTTLPFSRNPLTPSLPPQYLCASCWSTCLLLYATREISCLYTDCCSYLVHIPQNKASTCEKGYYRAGSDNHTDEAAGSLTNRS